MHDPLLRTVYLDAEADTVLRVEAFEKNTSKSSLLLHYLLLGMSIARRPPSDAQKAFLATNVESHVHIDERPDRPT